MKFLKSTSLIVLLAVLLLAAEMFAQGNGRYGRRGGRNMIYDVNTVETVRGVVQSVEEQTGRMGSVGIHAQLKTDNGTIDTHIGPKWFLDDTSLDLKKGDVITVTGSNVTYNNAPALIAASVKKDGEIVNLRSEAGFPVWSGQGKGMRGRTGKGNMGRMGRGNGRMHGNGNMIGQGRMGNRMYDPATVETVKGEITDVQTVAGNGRMGGIHLQLNTDGGEMEVHLGPAWYIENQKLVLKKGDMVEVTGSKIDYQGKPALIAASIEDNNKKVQLRNDAGLPNWSGGRR